jgi:hypothetical protein
MKLRKWLVLAAFSGAFFWAPSVIPTRAVAASGPCGIQYGWMTADTAFAAPAVVPCPSNKAPWTVYAIFASAVSVITNAILVSRTQCRELSQQEAMTSAVLPFVGMFWNKKNNRCRH